jgi:hypothetical protein
MQKYIIRALKYLVYFVVLFAIIVIILYLIREDRSQTILTMFEPNAWWKMAIFFVLVAAFYPALGYSKKTIQCTGGFRSKRDEIIRTLDLMDYLPSLTEKDNSNPESMRFRCKSSRLRFTRMGEDGVTITTTNDGDAIEIEGLRREVLAVASILDNKLNPVDPNAEPTDPYERHNKPNTL